MCSSLNTTSNIKENTMTVDFTLSPTPVSEIEADDVKCASCKKHLLVEAYYCKDEYYCEACLTSLVECENEEATIYAEEHCKITEPLTSFDSDYEFRCTPEEYALGMRESYTANSHLACLRHNCTNYDELIEPLDRENPIQNASYLAIRLRTDELIREKLAEMELAGGEEADGLEPNKS